MLSVSIGQDLAGSTGEKQDILPNHLLPNKSFPMNPSYSAGLQGMNMQNSLQRRQMAARPDPEDYPLFNLKGISFEDNCGRSASLLSRSEGNDVWIRRLHRAPSADRRADGPVGEGFHDQSRRGIIAPSHVVSSVFRHCKEDRSEHGQRTHPVRREVQGVQLFSLSHSPETTYTV